MLVASWFIGMIICFISHCYLFSQFNSYIDFKINYKIIAYSLFMGLLYYVMTKYNFVYFRPYLIHLFILFGLLLIYNEKFIKTLITLLCILIFPFISELIFGFVLIFFFKFNIQEFVNTWYGYIFSNMFIYLLSIFLTRVFFIKLIINNIIKWYDNNEFKSIIIFVILCMIVFTFFLYNNFVEILPNKLLWVTNIFCIAVIFFVINYFNEKANNNRIISEYDQLLKYVKKYEIIVEEKSKSQHEYKNQLILLKSLISKSNIKALKYIDDLNEGFKDSNNIELLNKLKYIPCGGLKGLIYFKLDEMYEKGLNVFIDVSSELSTTCCNYVIERNLKDISRVIGVYIDNAIEACLISKEKYIILEFYIEDDNLVFSISNSYSNTFDISKVEDEGYTTKGEGKGYGLSLVKDILNHNKHLYSKRELNGIYYVQKLYIKK